MERDSLKQSRDTNMPAIAKAKEEADMLRKL
jgi:hypothetical protein